MKSSPRQYSGNRTASVAALFAALAIALLAIAFSGGSMQSAFADDESTDAKDDVVELSVTEVSSETGIADKYKVYLKVDNSDLEADENTADENASDESTAGDDEDGDEADKAKTDKTKVTVTDITDDDNSRFIDIVASEDTAMAIVLVTPAAGNSWESSVPDGKLKANVHYRVPVSPADTKLKTVTLYQAKDSGDDEGESTADEGESGTQDPSKEKKHGTIVPQSDDDENSDDTPDGDDAENTDSGTSGTEPTGTDEDTGNGNDNDNGIEAQDDAGEATDETANDNEAAADQPAATTYALVIGKVDSKSGAALKGAEFQLKDPKGGAVSTWTTNGGNHQVEGLSKDVTYVLEETKAPEGYNRERPINIKYDSASGKVLIDQGGASKALDNDKAGNAVLTVKDVQGASSVQTSASTSPKTGDSIRIGVIAAVLVVIVAASAAVAVRARKKTK